jgi:lipopolysaccharide export system protein LptA
VKDLKLRQVMPAMLALGLFWTAGPVLAQEGVPVDIEAGEMEILENEGRAIFRGDVVAKRGSDTIRANEMTVTYIDIKKDDGTSTTEVDVLDCRGGVVITTPGQNITGDVAKFFIRKDELTVSGNVKVTQGKAVVRGPRLSVNLRTKRTVMAGGRVRGKFVPK